MTGAPPAFPPNVVVAIKALACELPHEHELPLSRLSLADIQQEAVQRGLVASKLEAVDIETTLDSPLQVAARIVDDVASQLEWSTVVVAELAAS